MPRSRVRPQFAPQDHRRHEHRGMRRYGVDAASGTHKHSAGPVTGASGGSLSYRDVEELLAKRGLEVSYETDFNFIL
jgi:hypothetical protein